MNWNPESPSYTFTVRSIFDDRRWHQMAVFNRHTSRHKCKFESYTRLIDIYIRNCGRLMSFIFLCLHNANYKLLLSFCVCFCVVCWLLCTWGHIVDNGDGNDGDNVPFRKLLRSCLVLLVINNFEVAEAVRSALCALWMHDEAIVYTKTKLDNKDEKRAWIIIEQYILWTFVACARRIGLL